MTEPIPEEDVRLPATTRELLNLLPELYNDTEFRVIVGEGNERKTMKYLGKLDLIDELRQLQADQDAEDAEALSEVATTFRP